MRVPPFVLRSDDGQWSGLSIDLWKQIAAELKLDFEFREFDYDPARAAGCRRAAPDRCGGRRDPGDARRRGAFRLLASLFRRRPRHCRAGGAAARHAGRRWPALSPFSFSARSRACSASCCCVGTLDLAAGAAAEAAAFRPASVAGHRRRRLVGGGDDDHHRLWRQGSGQLARTVAGLGLDVRQHLPHRAVFRDVGLVVRRQPPQDRHHRSRRSAARTRGGRVRDGRRAMAGHARAAGADLSRS